MAFVPDTGNGPYSSVAGTEQASEYTDALSLRVAAVPMPGVLLMTCGGEIGRLMCWGLFERFMCGLDRDLHLYVGYISLIIMWVRSRDLHLYFGISFNHYMWDRSRDLHLYVGYISLIIIPGLDQETCTNMLARWRHSHVYVGYISLIIMWLDRETCDGLGENYTYV